MPLRTISIADEFSRYPGPRYRDDGPHSGEEFRQELLTPALREAIARGDVLAVLLDDVAGYGSSFLEESFGGLLRDGFSLRDLQQHLKIEARTSRFQHHRVRAEGYIREEAGRKRSAAEHAHAV